MPASYQMGNMRGSVSTPDTEPLTPEYENNYFSHFFESNLDSSSQSAANDGGDHPLASSISQLLNYQRGIVPPSPNSASTPPLKSVFDYSVILPWKCCQV
ncbi:hypothetical protein LSTR_LSTR013177 [Laodelphax striatellus]|uniref:Uncharacterized protein n=1 Tax=Laodelphax striatellus TaxID=195883 RepID=A0A482X1H5_LAOST|nr:hypothetical protein LSTR_LSTR013177 [Laodelphax striatellus]